MTLTPRQAEILDWIRRFAIEHGYAPSRREIASKFRMSVNGAQNAITVLERKGRLQRAPGIPRSIVVIDASQLDETSELG